MSPTPRQTVESRCSMVVGLSRQRSEAGRSSHGQERNAPMGLEVLAAPGRQLPHSDPRWSKYPNVMV